MKRSRFDRLLPVPSVVFRAGAVALWMAVALWAPSASAEVLGGASTAFPILAVGSGARASGMGDSYVALADDASALYWNPGALGRLDEPSLLTQYQHYPTDGYDQSLALAYPLRGFGALGCDLSYRSYGVQDGYDLNGNPEGTFQPCDVGAGLGLGARFGPWISVGLRTFWFRQSAATYHETGLTENTGILLGPWQGWRLGFSVGNMGLDSNGYPLPLECRWGIARTILWGSEGRHRIRAACGMDFRRADENRLNLGVEYGYRGSVFLRLGWAPRWNPTDLGNLQGFSLGAGLCRASWALDYAIFSQGDLGYENLLSLSWTPPWAKGRVGIPSPDKALENEAMRSSSPGESGVHPPSGGNAGIASSETGKNNSAALSPSPASVRDARTAPPFPAPPLPSSDTGVTLSSAATPGKNGDAVVLKFQLMEEDDLTGAAPQLYLLGEKDLAAGKIDRALRCFQKCVEKDPRYEQAWIRIGQIQYQKAYEAVQKALKANPRNEALRRWLAGH